MKNRLEEIRLKHEEQQKVLEKEKKKKKLNQQQFKEEIEKLQQETEAKVQAEHDEFEARVRHEHAQRASLLEEIEKLRIILLEKEKLATEDRRKRQEIAKKYEEQLKSLQDQLNQNMISQQQFEDMRLKMESLKKDEIESKNQETAELKRQLELKELQELVKTSDDDEPSWTEDVGEGVAKFTYDVARGVGNAVAVAATAYDGVTNLFRGFKNLFDFLPKSAFIKNKVVTPRKPEEAATSWLNNGEISSFIHACINSSYISVLFICYLF